jgi:hypothetical protein
MMTYPEHIDTNQHFGGLHLIEKYLEERVICFDLVRDGDVVIKLT